MIFMSIFVKTCILHLMNCSRTVLLPANTALFSVELGSDLEIKKLFRRLNNGQHLRKSSFL